MVYSLKVWMLVISLGYNYVGKIFPYLHVDISAG